MRERIDIELKLRASGRALRGFHYPTPQWMYFAGYIEALDWVLGSKSRKEKVQGV
jgi:hypothetical protein